MYAAACVFRYRICGSPIRRVKLAGWLALNGANERVHRRLHLTLGWVGCDAQLVHASIVSVADLLTRAPKDEQPFVTSPDAIGIIDRESGEPHVNNSIAAGQRVAVLGRKAHAAHRSERGVAVLGPRHFGFDLDYVPIEKVMGDG